MKKNRSDKLIEFLRKIKFDFRYIYLSRMNPSKHKKYIKRKYKKSTGQILNFDKPINYTQKMQVFKIKEPSTLISDLTDKYTVREWVSEKIGEEYLVPLIDVWNSNEDINWNKLPNKFVLKANHGSGWNIVVKNKDELNLKKTNKTLKKWMKMNFFYSGGFEPQYKDIKPRIIAESFLQDKDNELNDYKFICFDGQPYYCWIDVGRYTKHYRNIYDLNWNLQPWNQYDYPNTPYSVQKPDNFEKMIEIATKLSQGFPHVRVDLYNVDGKIYFGEMTFTNSSGYELIHPEENNVLLGKLWDIE